MKHDDVIITLMLGPGNHHHKLVEAIKTYGCGFEVFNYYPKFSRTQYNIKGEKVSYKENKFLSWIVVLIWAITTRIKPIKNRNYHISFTYRLFDWWVSLSYTSTSKMLWAWSQMSLTVIKKFKNNNKPVILETPMIHVNEWLNILKTEYERVGKNHYKYYEIAPQLIQNMIQEYDLADEIIILSSYAHKTFIYHGIKPNKLIKVSLYAYEYPVIHIKKSPSKTFNLLFVGRVDVLKGIPRLINVICKLKNNHSIKLNIVGDVKEEVLTLFKETESEIILSGFKNQDELMEIYSNSDGLILPSVQESFGLVMLEALECGTPVLASTNTGGPDLEEVFEGVLLFDPFNEAEIEEKILSLLKNRVVTKRKKFDSYTKCGYIKEIHDVLNKYIIKYDKNIIY